MWQRREKALVPLLAVELEKDSQKSPGTREWTGGIGVSESLRGEGCI